METISKEQYQEACFDRIKMSRQLLWGIFLTIINIIMIFVSYNRLFGLFASLSIYLIIDAVIDLKNNWKVINQYLLEIK